jgi:hypothetical protein
MQWWNGKLYVGTVREYECWSLATLNNEYPEIFPYPPRDPEKECAPDVQDLPLRAEIWRFAPGTSTWERVFQSPEDVPIPGEPEKFTARDVGFRGMTLFTEPDGTEALYAGAVYPRIINPELRPPPRILRSSDGLTFEAIAPRTGDLPGAPDSPGFRGMVSYKDRLYVIASTTIWGAGPVLEADDPAGGLDNFRLATPEGVQLLEMQPYNGYLYVGTSSRQAEPPLGGGLIAGFIPPKARENGYSVLKTDASGVPPYTLTPVITDGGHKPLLASEGVASMGVFDGRLFVGTDWPPEIVRINPDDTWDLIVGDRRKTPEGWKWPLSGFESGFGWFFNIHVWRLQEHNGVLFTGTGDVSTGMHNSNWFTQRFGPLMGFDLFYSDDGVHFVPLTINGFEDKFHMGVRTFSSTPYGLFLGSINYWDGLGIWLGDPEYQLRFPLVTSWMDETSGSRQAGLLGAGSSASHPLTVGMPTLLPPQRLETETLEDRVVLSWEPALGVDRYHVFRSVVTPTYVTEVEQDVWVPGPFEEVSVTGQSHFVDVDVAGHDDERYLYYVQAEDYAGSLSPYSNLAPAPSMAQPMTYSGLRETIADWAGRGRFQEGGSGSILAGGTAGANNLDLALAEAYALAAQGAVSESLNRVEQIRLMVEQNAPPMLEPWCARDLEVMLNRLARRVRLVELGYLPLEDVE